MLPRLATLGGQADQVYHKCVSHTVLEGPKASKSNFNILAGRAKAKDCATPLLKSHVSSHVPDPVHQRGAIAESAGTWPEPKETSAEMLQ